MPLRSSHDRPSFAGTANDLPHYIAEVEALCQRTQRASDAELIKYAVYYTEGAAWDSFAATRDALAEPGTWDEFRAAIHGMYPSHDDADMAVPLPASLPPHATPAPSALAHAPSPSVTVTFTSCALRLLRSSPSPALSSPFLPPPPPTAAAPLPMAALQLLPAPTP